MPRKRIPLEAFDLATGWPIHYFDSFTAAGAAGFNRSAIGRVLSGKCKQHAGYGWRVADMASRLPEFLALHCVEEPDASLAECVEACDLVTRFGCSMGVNFPHRAYRLLDSRHGIVLTPVVLGRSVQASVVRGLVWA